MNKQEQIVKALLENQNKSADPAQFKRISLPLIRRIYPQLIVTGPPMPLDSFSQIEPVPVLIPSKYRTIDDSWTPSKSW
jgi:hypothetical protein